MKHAKSKSHRNEKNYKSKKTSPYIADDSFMPRRGDYDLLRINLGITGQGNRVDPEPPNNYDWLDAA